MDARTIAERILRDEGLSAEEAAEEAAESLRAQRNLDRRLEGLGLSPTTAPPRKLHPGPASAPRFPGGAASALLLDPAGAPPNPRVVLAAEYEEFSEALFEPSDLVAAQAVTGLATTAAGGTEVKFNVPGFVHVGSGAVGVYHNVALGASMNTRWQACSPGKLIRFDPRSGLFVGTNTVGALTIGGVLTLAFYRIPEFLLRRGRDRDDRERPPSGIGHPGEQPGDPGTIDPGGPSRSRFDPVRGFRDALTRSLAASGSDNTAGVSVGPGSGTDVTLGTFSDAGAGTQIFLAGSNMPVGGASRPGAVILNGRPANTDVVWVGETSALAVASNGGLGPSGQDTWNIPLGGTLFMLAASGTQVIGARYRS